jgi:hypothetical protein
VFGHYEGWYRHIVAEPRYSDLWADLRHFGARYARVEAGRRPLAWWLSTYPALASEPDFPAFYECFYNEVARRAAAIAAVGGGGGPVNIGTRG